MCSRPLELGRKGGQLRPQILEGIAANVLKAVGTREERGQLRPQILEGIAANMLKAVGTRKERGAIAPPNFGKNRSKWAQGRRN